MKKTLFIILQILFLSHLYGQETSPDWQQMRLVGKVKKITEIKIKCPTVMAENGEFYCRKDTINYEFNDKGYLLNKTASDNQNTETKIQNKQKIITIYEIVDEVKKRSSEDIYNSKNQLVIQTNYYVHGKEEELLTQWEYFYNKKGMKIKQKTTSFWNGTKTVYINDFNKQGDEIKGQTFINDILTEDESFTYDYKYDKKGNWINKTLFEDNKNWQRKITYY